MVLVIVFPKLNNNLSLTQSQLSNIFTLSLFYIKGGAFELVFGMGNQYNY
jgi:hypothetical protein